MRKRWYPVAELRIGGLEMNAVGIDISKGKSMVAVMRPFGEVVFAPFEISHTDKDLTELAKTLKSLPGETRVVMEATGSYHVPVAWMLQSAGLYVSVVNAVLVHDYGNNSLRRVKTDKKDAVKLANYALDRWLSLPRFAPEEENRQLLKTCYRQYQHHSKVQTALNNNLISLSDTVFPNVNRLFKSPARDDGSEKWVDFLHSFWHKECVSKLSLKAFTAKYQKWCGKHGYHFSEQKALEVHTAAKSSVAAMPNTGVTKCMVQQAVSALQACSKALAELGKQMLSLASSLPEYPVVMKMFGVGPTLGPQLMAEIGDVRRFHSKKALVAYAGIDSPPDDSGQVVGKHKKMTKVGSSALRRTLFLVMSIYLQRSPKDQPVFQFMNRKRAEGKPYKVYMMASANKFLRIYYATVKAYLNSLNQT
jgi:transposase